ncbi:hypothetical protein L1F30_01615 [Simiduia sp. 21SJ11W-1]|uniref:hypothetical protein n=1 Tax=Simiduia sp. 21SJ11W-1 TaxID=2909669 RepID=UPI00209EE9A0|nr:hypothetical protein [Simiduia sp. 21SJ11W-1]UTA48251.1 hypothetical protein L1F30_01615 [Simiduia sp. 21SJ11W-1]
MKDQVRSVLEEMRAKYSDFSFEQIKEIGWVNLESIRIEGKKYWPSIWSQVHKDDDYILVVQLTRWYFLRIVGSTDCIGYRFHKSGGIEEIDEIYLMNEVGHP